MNVQKRKWLMLFVFLYAHCMLVSSADKDNNRWTFGSLLKNPFTWAIASSVCALGALNYSKNLNDVKPILNLSLVTTIGSVLYGWRISSKPRLETPDIFSVRMGNIGSGQDQDTGGVINQRQTLQGVSQTISGVTIKNGSVTQEATVLGRSTEFTTTFRNSKNTFSS